MIKVVIIDGYIDEPTCLGVPPYISPYPRYIAGAIWDFDKKNQINYYTIDQIRNQPNLVDKFSKTDIVIVIAGMSVPGRYLSGYPASPNEIIKILMQIRKPLKILTGPAACHGFGMGGGQKTQNIDKYFNIVIQGDPEIVLYDFLKHSLKLEKIDITSCRINPAQIRYFANIGAEIVKQHPNHPDYLITEIETYRGCPRIIVGGCSFCSEPSKGLPDFRQINDIAEEIQNLYNNGIRHFRLGNQPCIYSYMSKDAGEKEFPSPNPEAIEELFRKIRNVAPDLKTLHIDNANPGVIARYPEEAEKITKTIIKYHTPGDVAAMGIESVDPVVIEKNNLKATKEECFNAIKLVNKFGSKHGYNGMPELLPGLNFIFGLKGETKETFEQDFEFLKKIFKSNLLVRRINLRQVIPIPGTSMFNTGLKLVNKHKLLFKKFKRKVQEEIERPMLEKMLPQGSVLKQIYTEKHYGKLTFARQVGSYPLLVGVPGIFVLGKFIDVRIVDYGFRSITGIPYPLNVNTASRETLEAIPGIGKKRTIRILANRPFEKSSDFKQVFDDPIVFNQVKNYFDI